MPTIKLLFTNSPNSDSTINPEPTSVAPDGIGNVNIHCSDHVKGGGSSGSYNTSHGIGCKSIDRSDDGSTARHVNSEEGDVDVVAIDDVSVDDHDADPRRTPPTARHGAVGLAAQTIATPESLFELVLHVPLVHGGLREVQLCGLESRIGPIVDELDSPTLAHLEIRRQVVD